MTTTLIGIDCATQTKNIGIALGFFENGKTQIDKVIIGSRNISIVDTIAGWIPISQNTLIAIDAPLGWPKNLGEELQTHEAGKPIHVEPNQLFRRETDHFIKREVGKQPLDVGADRIARTAHAALHLLEEIREKTGQAISLTWEPGISKGVYAIEVYPAATLIAYGINVPGYKQKDGKGARKLLLRQLFDYIDLPTDISLMEKNDDALDAAICVLAGADFLRRDVYKPMNLELAKKEGWIWVKRQT
mgnify:CR=1 FL=1